MGIFSFFDADGIDFSGFGFVDIAQEELPFIGYINFEGGDKFSCTAVEKEFFDSAPVTEHCCGIDIPGCWPPDVIIHGRHLFIE